MKTTVVYQSEAAECGLACLAMIASSHGIAVSLFSLRARFQLSLKGAKLAQLMLIASQLGLRSRALRLEIQDLGKLRLPCILHWNFSHFVVLDKLSRKRCVVLDPASGERRMTLAELSQQFTGVALELAPQAGFVCQKSLPNISLGQITGPITGIRAAIVQLLLLSVVLQLFVALGPFLLQWVIDHVLVSADHELLVLLGLAFGCALLLQIAIGVVRGWCVLELSSRLGRQWLGNVFAHLLRLPLCFFEKRHLGDITSRLGSVQFVQRLLTTSFVEAVIDGLMAILTLILMLIYSWQLAVITVLAVTCYLLIRAWSYRTLRDRTENQLTASARQQTHLLESLRGMQSLKIAGHENLRHAAFENLMVETTNQDVRLGRLTLAFSSVGQFLFGAERIVVIWIGAKLALAGTFSVGMLIAYLAYKDQFAARMNALIDKWIEFRMLRLHGERLADIVLTEPEPTVVAPLMGPAVALDRIDVERLSFRYGDGEPWVLRDLSLTITPGDYVAIVGDSGCGKTTLLKLLLGLLTPSHGVIRIGGRDLQQLGAANFRELVGAVMQDDQLFAGSIADNISFFAPDPDPLRIEAAAKLAAVHDDIVAMPMSYYSLIGDMGSALSGGQRQRLLLARALYRRPRILMLDEATSHLDVRREKSVNDAIRQLRLTKIIIAHRPETIASADRVIALARVTTEP